MVFIHTEKCLREGVSVTLLEIDYKYLGSNVRKKRVHLNMTQEGLANQIGISTSFVGHIERGTRKASMETLARLSVALDESIDSLLIPPELGITSKYSKEQQMQAKKLLEYALSALSSDE